MDVEAGLKFLLQQCQFLGQFPAVLEGRAHPDEGPHNEDAHLGCAGAIKDIGGHDGAMLSKGVRKVAWVPMLLGTRHNL